MDRKAKWQHPTSQVLTRTHRPMARSHTLKGISTRKWMVDGKTWPVESSRHWSLSLYIANDHPCDLQIFRKPHPFVPYQLPIPNNINMCILVFGNYLCGKGIGVRIEHYNNFTKSSKLYHDRSKAQFQFLLFLYP